MGSLWDRVLATTEKALDRGAIAPIPTEQTVVEDGGIPFVVHVTSLQERKAEAAVEQARESSNPFLPPDDDLIVSPLPPRHLALLNRFNVLRHHLLIVTRDFEPQENLLNREDFRALAECMSSFDGLGFYNAGATAGASQSHKHLQLVPLPLGSGPMPTPLDAVIPTTWRSGTVTTVPGLDFTHAAVPLPGTLIEAARSDELFASYTQACAAVEIHSSDQPYNMLLTRRWLLLVPRSTEFWRDMSINALGFAGSLLVRNHTELGELRAIGPLDVLKSVVEGRR